MSIDFLKTVLFFTLGFNVLLSCKKQLEVKSDMGLAIPKTLTDAQALLDSSPAGYVEPGADEASADNYYLKDASYNALSNELSRALYAWDKGNQFDGSGSAWGIAYLKIYYCNTALEAMPPSGGSNSVEWDNVKGQALFKRAKTFWHIANIWSLAYDSITAATDLGIPLRLNTNPDERSVRASLKETYERIFTDLKASLKLLPVQPLHPIRPSKPAAYAMLSRVYLSVRNYNKAKLYADSALTLFPTLIDYNTVNSTPIFPFVAGNAETIFQTAAGDALLSPTNAKIDSVLYQSYHNNDLRKSLFFRSLGNNEYSFRGSYTNSDGQFAGLSSSELYLTRAECLARAQNLPAALADLNTLLIKRFKTGTFVPVNVASPTEALTKILEERRKELIMRYTRWMDIKRLNKEGAGITLRRFINGEMITLPPNDLRYALALPQAILDLTGMQQNPR